MAQIFMRLLDCGTAEQTSFENPSGLIINRLDDYRIPVPDLIAKFSLRSATIS
jgi:hypothetical protein